MFDFQDSVENKFKAECAAEKLKQIYPEVNAQGHTLEIPMPGHFTVSQEHTESMLRSMKKVDELVASHDVLFLLTDNRESRWLPTLLANKYDKLCITVALGFDSFMIQRHGRQT